MLNKLKELTAEVAALKEKDGVLAQELADKVADLEKQIDEAAATRKSVMPTTSEKDVESAVKAVKAAYLKSAIMGKPMTDFEGFKEAKEVVEKALKPADVANWVAEAFASDVIEEMELELKVAGLFDKITVPDGYGSLSVPARTAKLKAYLIAPATDAIESVLNDGKVTFATTKLKTMTVLADEMNDEVVKAVAGLAQKELTRSIARAVEDVVVMGDTTGAANDATSAADGIYKAGKVNGIDAGGTSITLGVIAQARATMGALGINPAELALVVEPTQYNKLVQIPEVLTIDKVGAQASLLTGAVASVYGISVIVSEYIPTNMSATGVNDGSADTTAAILVNKSGFMRADRTSGLINKSDNNIVSDTLILTASYQFDFKPVTANSEVAAVSIFNLK